MIAEPVIDAVPDTVILDASATSNCPRVDGVDNGNRTDLFDDVTSTEVLPVSGEAPTVGIDKVVPNLTD
jgi:hypothetical protein